MEALRRWHLLQVTGKELDNQGLQLLSANVQALPEQAWTVAGAIQQVMPE